MNKKEIAFGVFVCCVGVAITVSFVFSLCWLDGMHKWRTTDALRENIVVNIPECENATHVEAWVDSANPYAYTALNKTAGIVSLPASLTFDTYWNNATLHVTYYQYRTVSGAFDGSNFIQNQYYELETKEYFLDLTELD